MVADLLERLGESSIERWSEATWETFTLQALWLICREQVQQAEQTAGFPKKVPAEAHQHYSVRHRDLLFQVTGEDSDSTVNDLLIRFSAAFLDQGMARWPLPNRDAGYLKAFCSLYRLAGGSPDWCRLGLAKELARIEDNGISSLPCGWEKTRRDPARSRASCKVRSSFSVRTATRTTAANKGLATSFSAALANSGEFTKKGLPS